MLNNFYSKHFLILSIISAVFSPKMNVLSRFSRYIRPGIQYSADVNATPSRGKQAWLAAWPNPQTVGSSKWAFTEPWLICAQCGPIISVFGELTPRHALFVVSVDRKFFTCMGSNFSLAWRPKNASIFSDFLQVESVTPYKWKMRIFFWHFFRPLQVKRANFLLAFFRPHQVKSVTPCK